MKTLALTIAMITAAAATGLAQPIAKQVVPVVKGAQVVSKAEAASVTGKGDGVKVKLPADLKIKVKL